MRIDVKIRFDAWKTALPEFNVFSEASQFAIGFRFVVLLLLERVIFEGVIKFALQFDLVLLSVHQTFLDIQIHLILSDMKLAFVSHPISRVSLQRSVLRIIEVPDSLLKTTIQLRTIILEWRQVVTIIILSNWHFNRRMINTGVPHLLCLLKGA